MPCTTRTAFLAFLSFICIISLFLFAVPIFPDIFNFPSAKIALGQSSQLAEMTIRASKFTPEYAENQKSNRVLSNLY